MVVVVVVLSAADPVEPGMQLWASGPVFDDSDHATLVRATRAVRPRPPIPLGERVVHQERVGHGDLLGDVNGDVIRAGVDA
jgi:hypothetical protein